MRRTRAAAIATATALSATLLGQAWVAPTWAAGTTTWRPGEPDPAGTGFWSTACGTPQTTAHGPAGLSDDTADLARTRSFVRRGGDVAWRYSPGTRRAGIAVTLPDPAHTSELSVRARSASAKGVQERLLVAYQPPGADADTYFIGTATRSVGPDTGTTDLSDRLVWLQHHGAGLFQGPGWSAVFPTKPLDPSTNAPRSLREFAASRSYRGGVMLAGYELGCTGDAFTVDHLVVDDSTGRTDLDLAAQRTTTTLTTDHAVLRVGRTAVLLGDVVGGATGSTLGGAVALEAAPYGSDTFTRVGRMPAPAPNFTVRPDRTTRYRLHYLGTAAAAGSTSAPVTVEVSSVVALHAASDRVRLGSRARLTGTVRPGLPGVPVTLQQQSGDTWIELGHTTTAADGSYRFGPRTRRGGQTAYRALVGRHDGTLGATSKPVPVLVTVPTKVTAVLSTDTIRTGRTLKVTGSTSAGRTGLLATLQRRVDGHWARLAQVRTTSRGRFAFAVTAGTPGTWTLRVRVAGRTPYLPGVSPRRTVTITPKPQPAPPPPPAPEPTPEPTPEPPPSSGGGGTGIG